MDNRQLLLTFDETVDASTIRCESFTLSSANALGLAVESFQLADDCILTGGDDTDLIVNLTET
jgi:hypothetical protein